MIINIFMKDSAYYLSLYDKFIKTRSARQLTDCIIEIHHIIPKCKGGSDNDSNLIALTSREHFLAHLILHKSDKQNIGLKKALQAMFKGDKRQQVNRNFNSRFYTLMRESVFVKIPSKKDLEEHYNNNLSFKKIALIYGVSDMTVCKWFKIHKIHAKQATDYKFKKPTKEDLKSIIDEDIHPYNKTREHYNISRSLLYKWLDSYQLNRPAIYPRPKHSYS